MSLISQSTHQCDCLDCRMERSFTDFGRGRIPKAKPRSKPSIAPSREFKSTQRRRTSCMIDKLKPPAEVIPPNLKISGPSLNIFPVPRNSEVATTLQYYFEVFACSMHPHKEDAPEAWQGTSFWSDRLQTAMADPMWFCAMIAFAEAMKNKTLHDSHEKTDIIIKYQSKAFMDLRKRLTSEKDNEMLVLTITVLMSIDIAFGSVESLKMHAEGLDRIIQARGGLESLNGNSYLKNKVIGFQLFWLSKQMALATTAVWPEYPEHPFSSELCITIAKLPRELGDLALSGVLNVNIIRLAADMSTIMTKINRDGTKRPEDLRRLKLLGYEMEECFKLRGMNQLERLICAALVDFSTILDSDRAQHWLLGGALRMNVSPLWCQGVKWEKKHSRFMIWGGAMLVACSETGSLTYRLGSDTLNTCMDHETLDRESILKICKVMIWDEVLTEKMDQKFDFVSTPSNRSTSASKSPSASSRTLSDSPPSSVTTYSDKD